MDPSVSIVAQNESDIKAPVFASNTIQGDVNIIYNASGNTSYHPDSEETQTSAINSVISEYKELTCTKYQYVTEYNSLPGENVLLCQRYIEPLIIQKYRDRGERVQEICSKGESFQQVLSARSSHESVLNTLFNPDDCGVTPKAVILQGNSGHGKSFAVQKIMMDWASGNAYKEQFEIVFHLKCKEINCISDEKSLVDVLSWSSGLTSDQILQMLQQSSEKVLFLVDGFDELRLTQDINHLTAPTDPHQRCKPELTLCALLKGHLQPKSFLLVTTRSTATDTLQRLLRNPQRFTEIMGFSKRGVEKYFQKFFQDDELFRKAYESVKKNETLFAACSIPVICWIICTVIRERFNHGADATSSLETTTSIYVDFVSTLLEHHCQGLNESVPTLLRSLGQLAERGMMRKQVLFDEKTVNEIVKDPGCCPFLCKFLFKKRTCQETMFSFMHLSFQEFFTALYYVLLGEDWSIMKLTQCLHSLYYLNTEGVGSVLIFAFGLLNKDLQHRLRKHGLFVHQNTQVQVKAWLLNEIKCPYSSITIYLIHLLYELHDKSFAEESMKAWDCISLYETHMSRTDCWALLYCAQCSDSVKRMVLKDCKIPSEQFSMILPVLHKAEKLVLTLKDPTDSDLVDLMCALTQRWTLKPQCVDVSRNYVMTYDNCSVRSLNWSFSSELFSVCIVFAIKTVVESLCLTVPCSEPIDWTKFFQIFPNMDLDDLTSVIHSVSNVKRVELFADCLNESLCVWALSLIQKCPSLTELWIDARFLKEECISILQRSQTRPNCTSTFKGLRCNKQSQKCTLLQDYCLRCNEMVKIYVNSRGFAGETSSFKVQSSRFKFHKKVCVILCDPPIF